MKRLNCNSWVFYDCDIDARFQSVVSRCASFFDVLGIAPAFAICDTNDRQGTPTALDRAFKKALNPDIRSIGLYAAGKDDFANSWQVQIDINRHPQNYITFHWNSEIAGLASGGIVEYFKKIVLTAQPLYGIGYDRTFAKGPEYFAVGIVQGLGYTSEEMLEAETVGAWFRENLDRNRHREGFLRDVFPINILTESHIRKDVNGRGFRAWANSRGSLEPIGPAHWLWRVPAELIPIAKKELHGRLIVEDA